MAVGRGMTDAIGTPDLRGVLTVSIVPGAAPLAPIHPVVPDGDADGDGIPDSVDKCPHEPEDKDGFQDADGCPDPDNDGDGIPDELDKCPLDPEDKDGFQDADGCPDPDNDGDGIPDKLDKCPNEPEDKDGFEDLDGCPDPDNDHDGIPDEKDKCPNEPETINGFQDDDGCPDKGDSTIILSPDKIETLDPIQFTAVKLAKSATPLIEQVGATLRAHPEILRVRITVHVQPTSDQDADQARTDKRAQAARDWLVQWGVAPARLEARGFGGTKPLVDPDQRGAAKLNDRIEFIILERK
jgi:large repetitive protein